MKKVNTSIEKGMKIGVMLIVGFTSFAQASMKTTAPQSLSSIAVANPYVSGLESKAQSISKMMRLELIKMQTYKVYDEFDMVDIIQSNEEFQNNCYGQNCLLNLGEALNTDYVLCGSFDGLANRIAITLKIIDVKNKTLYKTAVKEFGNQEFELQRMIEIVLKQMLDVPVPKEIVDRLDYKNDPITSSNVGQINNSGPRIGLGFMTGSLNEFARRPESQGGLDIQPVVSMIGYQFEQQYVGTENFSALFEGILNVSGLEQGQFLPTFTIMNGFRFGKAGWEIAFGPGVGIKKTSSGFFDTENNFSSNGRYFSEREWYQYANNQYKNDPAYIQNNQFIPPSPTDINPNYTFGSHFDTRGDTKLNTTFLFAFGRTFRAGSLNIPVNAFYSAQRGGGLLGINVGFNVQKSKTSINR